MPLVDVNHKKDVAKEGDRPAESGRAAQDARHALSLEATKPVLKAETKAEGKAEAKVEVKVGTQAENKTESQKSASDGYGSYLAAAFDSASATFKQTMAMLPALSIENASGKQMDKMHSINKSLDLDALMQSKSADSHTPGESEKSSVAGFTFNTDSKVQHVADSKDKLTLAESKLSADDWKRVTAAYDLIDPNSKNKIESTTFGSIHRDSSGKIDDVRHNGQADIHSASENISINDAGDKVLTDSEGHVNLFMNKEGRAEGILKSGQHVVIERDEHGKKRLYTTDAQGQPTSDIYEGESGSFNVEGRFVNGKAVTTSATLDEAGGIVQVQTEMKAEAIRTKTNQIKRFLDGLVAVTPEGSLIAVKQDHTSLMSTADGGFIVRAVDGSLTIHQPGKAPVKLSRAQVLKELASKAPEIIALHQTIKQLMSFGVNSVLKSADGKSQISLKDNRLSGSLNEVATNATSTGQTIVTGLEKGESQTINTATRSVTLAHNDGTVDKIEMTAKGDFKFEGKGYTYNDGVATTSDGNKISADGITMANGNVYHNDGSVNYADGSKITASGQITNSTDSQRTEKVAAQQAAESQATSTAGYAMGLAGAMRSKAASGHATAGDIAALEATFAGLCEAVTALSSAGDFSTQFKLYSAQSSVSESIDLGYAHLNETSKQPQTLAA